jgi:hypothetical protein
MFSLLVDEQVKPDKLSVYWSFVENQQVALPSK